MNIKAVFNLNEGERISAFSHIMESSYPGASFFTLLGVSAVIASGGLILGNSAVVIGSMLVAPVLAPIMSLSIGLVVVDQSLIKRSLIIISKAILLVIGISFVTGLILTVPGELNNEILSRTEHSFPYLLIAIAAGVAASISLTKKEIRESVVGVAVSVALLPPLSATGLGLAGLKMSVVTGAFQLFLINLLGTVFAGLATFSLMGFQTTKNRVSAEIKKEEVKLEEEAGENLSSINTTE